ncbi:hypothetical protein D3C83_49830 [compost metagenome]
MHALVEPRIVAFGIRHEAVEFGHVVVDEAEHRAAEVGVAAAFFLRRLFDNKHAFRAVLLGRERGAESGIAGADDDDIVIHSANSLS